MTAGESGALVDEERFRLADGGHVSIMLDAPSPPIVEPVVPPRPLPVPVDDAEPATEPGPDASEGHYDPTGALR